MVAPAMQPFMFVNTPPWVGGSGWLGPLGPFAPGDPKSGFWVLGVRAKMSPCCKDGTMTLPLPGHKHDGMKSKTTEMEMTYRVPFLRFWGTGPISAQGNQTVRVGERQ